MSDDLGKKQPQDRMRINTSERWEVDYWTKKLGVSEQELKDAVKAVGPMASAVEKELRKSA